MNELFIILRKDNIKSIEAVLSVGFVQVEGGDTTNTYRYKKPVHELKKVN